MRLFLLPISARRTLIYCDKHFPRRVPKAITAGEQPNDKQIPSSPASEKQITTGGQTTDAESTPKQDTSDPSPPSLFNAQNLLDRITTKAATTWATWEQTPTGWKRKVTDYGNALLRRIPYEEWGLKSFSPITQRKREKILAARKMVSVLFPGAFLKQSEVPDILKKLATERQDLHRRRMWGCLVGAPLTLPFALVPIVPNIPGFYMLFRAYSHYRALYGARHLEFLVQNQLVEAVPSQKLDDFYAKGRPETSGADVAETVKKQQVAEDEDVMLLNKESGVLISEAFETKEMAVEIERAVEQVEKIVLKKPDDKTTTDKSNEKWK